MNDYIISPMWFYFLDVLGELEITLWIIALIFGITLLVLICFQLVEISDAWKESDVKAAKARIKKLVKLSSIPVICLVVAILIPSKDTMYEMMIAKYITHENLSISVEAVKSAVDYIVEAFKAVK